MSGWAIAGALLVLTGCVAQDGVTRPARGALILIGLLVVLVSAVLAVAAATLE